MNSGDIFCNQDYFCEFDSISDSEERPVRDHDNVMEADDVTISEETDDIVYRLARMFEDEIDDNSKFDKHEENFIYACRQLLEVSLSKTEDGDNKSTMKEVEYLSICSQIKTIFESHKQMMKIMIRINHDLKERVVSHGRLLIASDELNQRISEELSEMRTDLHELDSDAQLSSA